MFVGNFLKTGDHVMFVPLGMLITLQYDENGLLEKVFQGLDREVDISNSLLIDLLENQKVPRKIALKNGTTFVRGTICVGDELSGTGKLPEALNDAILKRCVEDPECYTVYVGDIESLAASFQGGLMISQWLLAAGFKIFSSMVVPTDFKESDMLSKIIALRDPYTIPKAISGYFIHTNLGYTYRQLDRRICKVTNVDTYVEITGQVKSKIETTCTTLFVDYSVVVYNNLHKDDILILDEDDEILYSKTTATDQISSIYVCKTCGSKTRVSYGTRTICNDLHCNSRKYPAVSQLLSTLNLPKISKTRYDGVIKKIGKIFSVVDILDEPEFEDIQVEASIGNIMRSIIPLEVVPGVDSQIFNQFATRCNNTITTVEYYLSHTNKMSNDLGMEFPDSLVKWLADQVNYADLTSLFHMKQIQINNQSCKFEGYPIFRGKTIYITGDFIHGDSTEIISILRSYSAEVTLKFDNDVDCVIIGDVQSNVNGKSIANAKKLHKPIFSESEFFETYQIDEDIAENL